MKPLAEQTLYEILEVPDDAPPGVIQKAYERARALYGTDSLATYTLMAPEEVALLGRRIEEARNVLLDPVARAGYDARLASGTPLPRSGRTSDSTPTITATVPPGFQQIPAEQVSAPAAVEAPALAGTPVPAPDTSPPVVAAPLAAAPEPVPAAPAEAAAGAPVIVPAAAPVSSRLPAVAERVSPSSPGPASERPVPGGRAPERSVFIPEGARWTGEMLRRAREARGLTVKQLAEKTKITRHHIENVEGDRFGQLPAPVYLRGMVMSMARELRLDGQKVARSYLEHMAAHPLPSK